MIQEDLNVFFDDFGVEATLGTLTFKVLLDLKDDFVNASVARFKDFDLTALKITTDAPALKPNDTLTIDSKSYKVIEFERIDDGALTRLYMNPAR